MKKMFSEEEIVSLVNDKIEGASKEYVDAADNVLDGKISDMQTTVSLDNIPWDTITTPAQFGDYIMKTAQPAHPKCRRFKIHYNGSLNPAYRLNYEFSQVIGLPDGVKALGSTDRERVIYEIYIETPTATQYTDSDPAILKFNLTVYRDADKDNTFYYKQMHGNSFNNVPYWQNGEWIQQKKPVEGATAEQVNQITTNTNNINNIDARVTAAEDDIVTINEDRTQLHADIDANRFVLTNIQTLTPEQQAQVRANANLQEKLVAGENITISDDGKTISATGGGGGGGNSDVNVITVEVPLGQIDGFKKPLTVEEFNAIIEKTNIIKIVADPQGDAPRYYWCYPTEVAKWMNIVTINFEGFGLSALYNASITNNDPSHPEIELHKKQA